MAAFPIPDTNRTPELQTTAYQRPSTSCLPCLAEAVLQVLQAIPDAKWNATAAGEDYTQNNIPHEFYSTKHASAIIDAVVRTNTPRSHSRTGAAALALLCSCRGFRQDHI